MRETKSNLSKSSVPWRKKSAPAAVKVVIIIIIITEQNKETEPFSLSKKKALENNLEKILFN